MVRRRRPAYPAAALLADKDSAGKGFNAPNDAVVHPNDGSIWFTDPVFGLPGNYEGNQAESETAQAVYRIDGATGEMTAVATDFEKPNGLAFSPDESLLYIADTGASHREDGPRHIRTMTVSGDGKTLGGGEVFATCPVGEHLRCAAARLFRRADRVRAVDCPPGPGPL